MDTIAHGSGARSTDEPGVGPAGTAEAILLAALRAGDEDVFRTVVRAWSPGMLRMARLHVSTDASAQEVVQDTWVAVLRGLAAFEGRSSLHTWVFRIMLNTAKTRGVRESRAVTIDLTAEDDDGGPTVDPDRFEHSRWRHSGGWSDSGAPQPWDADPVRGAIRGETRALLAAALRQLPARQRDVVVLRDVQGLDADDVCEVLSLTPANQRVLLHRGRARLRSQLEDYYRQGNR